MARKKTAAKKKTKRPVGSRTKTGRPVGRPRKKRASAKRAHTWLELPFEDRKELREYAHRIAAALESQENWLRAILLKLSAPDTEITVYPAGGMTAFQTRQAAPTIDRVTCDTEDR